MSDEERQLLRDAIGASESVDFAELVREVRRQRALVWRGQRVADVGPPFEGGSMKRLSEFASDGTVDRQSCSDAWGAYFSGANTVGAARIEGILVDGDYVNEYPCQVTDRHVVGAGRRPAVRLTRDVDGDPSPSDGSPSPNPWNAALFSTAGSYQVLSDLAVSGGAVARYAVRLDRFSGQSYASNVRAVGGTDAAIYLYRCQSALGFHSMWASGSLGDGIVIEGCNGLNGNTFRAIGNAGTGIKILGDYAIGSSAPWPFQGDVALTGVNSEGNDVGIEVRDHVAPVNLGGQVRVESGVNNTRKGLIVDHCVVNLAGGRLSSSLDQIHVRNSGTLVLQGAVSVARNTGNARVIVEPGSTIINQGLVMTYPGGTIDWLTAEP